MNIKTKAQMFTQVGAVTGIPAQQPRHMNHHITVLKSSNLLIIDIHHSNYPVL